MNKTIDERLHLAFMHEADVVIAARAYEASAANIAADKRDAIRYSIIADWNAARDAMKAVVKQAAVPYTEWEPCRLCGTGMMGHMADCAIPQLQAALAQMEGHSHSHSHSHSRDEAMVEDKRYEKDEIYKK